MRLKTSLIPGAAPVLRGGLPADKAPVFFLTKRRNGLKMKTEMRFGNNAVRTVAVSLFTGLTCLLFLTGCPGTGSSHQGGGPVYTGGTAGSSESPASQAMHNINTGSINKLVELFTDGIGGTGTASTVPMDFPAEDLWLPEDATIKITMTVNGVTTVYTSTAVNGNFHFDLPAVVTGSFVSVRMDVIDSYGDLMCTGRASKTVQGATDTLELTLSSFVVIDLVPAFTADAWVWIMRDDPAWGWYTYSGNDPEYPASVHDFGKSVEIGGLALVGTTIYEIPTQTMILGSVDSLTLTLNTARKIDSSCYTLVASDPTGTNYYGTISCMPNFSNPPALYAQVDPWYYVMTATDFGYSSSENPATWGTYTSIDPDNLYADMMGNISNGWWMKMDYTLTLDGVTVSDTVKSRRP